MNNLIELKLDEIIRRYRPVADYVNGFLAEGFDCEYDLHEDLRGKNWF